MEQLTITVYKTVEEDFYFRLRDENDNIMLTSIQYSGYANCVNDIYMMQMYGDMDFILEKCPETSRRKLSSDSCAKASRIAAQPCPRSNTGT